MQYQDISKWSWLYPLISQCSSSPSFRQALGHLGHLLHVPIGAHHDINGSAMEDRGRQEQRHGGAGHAADGSRSTTAGARDREGRNVTKRHGGYLDGGVR